MARTKIATRPASPRPKKADPAKWWAQAEEVPRAGLPDAKKLTKRAKRLRWLVWASVILFPITLLSLLVSLGNQGSGIDPAALLNQYADTKGVAVVAVDNWLAQTPPPLPGGRLIGWDSATDTEKAPDRGQSGSAYDVQVHHLTVADSAGNLYDTEVSLATSDAIGTVVIGQPTLLPQAPSVTTFGGSDWPTLTTTSAAQPVTQAVTAWAQAYSSTDPNQLRLVIGDTNPNRNYVTLNGATLGDPQVGAAAYASTSGKSDPGTLVVRASFAITWPGTPATNGSASLPRVTYDLLVQQANTAAPKVVAWGGPGTGPDLTPYGNAITGRQVSAGTAPSASPNAPASSFSDETQQAPTSNGSAK